MVTGVYVVCLDCGKEFSYDWGQMKVLRTSGMKAVKQKKIAANFEERN